MKRTRLTALALAACMVGALLTGCGGSSTSSAAPAESTKAVSEAAPNETTTIPASDAEETSTVEAADGCTYAPISYPLEDGGTLS